jgi:dephospho-CoA kinase
MQIVGLTGGIGSGKSTIARLFADQGVHWVDADDVAREVVEPGTPALQAIADHFGPAILLESGELNRPELRSRIFQDEPERRWLEQLLHPLIREAMLEQLKPRDYNLPYTLLVSPLLLETDQHTLVDRIVVVDVPVEVQIKRTVSRDGNTPEQVQRIIDAQMSRDKRVGKADHIITNAGGVEDAMAQVASLHAKFVDELQPRL